MDKIIVDKPERLEEDIADFKIDAVEAEKNFTTARIRVCRNPETESPVIFYSQELNRNFKNPSDLFGKRFLLKAFNSTNALASADVALERKFKDTVLAHKSVITDYSPLTDIHSDAMGLFVDEDTAMFLSDVGINVDGLGEDFLGIESVTATPYMEEVAVDVGKLKSERCSLNEDLARVKEQIKREIGQVNDNLSFEELLASHRVSDALVQQYLSLCERIGRIQKQLGQASDVVFSETKTRIRLPARIDFDL